MSAALRTCPTLLTVRRVLVVEDETIISMLIEDFLTDLGCLVVGVAARLDDALIKAHKLQLDVAILDINLMDKKSFPVAALLRSRSVPFVFLTGYGPDGLSAEFQGSPILTKPCSSNQLSATLSDIFARRQASLSEWL